MKSVDRSNGILTVATKHSRTCGYAGVPDSGPAGGILSIQATSWKQRRRASRIERRRDLRDAGRTPAQIRYIYRVDTTIISIPDWAFEKAVLDLKSTRDFVWLSDRQLAKHIWRMDREEGGNPRITRTEARRCDVCGMLRLNLLAESRREVDERAVDGRQLPCSPECLARFHQNHTA